MDAAAAESRTERVARTFAQVLPPLIGAVAWAEWHLVPLLVEPEGDPFKYPRHCFQALMLDVLCFVAVPVAMLAYRKAHTRLLGLALPASKVLWTLFNVLN